jgi:hypothetical protein
MLWFTVQSQSKNGLVFYYPDFVRALRGAFVGERPHGLPDFLVFFSTEMTDDGGGLRHLG